MVATWRESASILDYFNQLGINRSVVYPVLENDGQVTARTAVIMVMLPPIYYYSRPTFSGTNADYKQLIDEAHGRKV